MNLNQLINDYSEIISLFLDYSGNTIVILADYEYRVLCWSTSLAELMHVPDKPIGRFLGDLLCPLEESDFSLIITDKENTMLPQIFKICYTDILYRCYSFQVDKGYLLFGDRIGSTDNEILESMSLLNNELSNLSRKLSKKNRELERANSKINELMRTDHLTGLANRRYFQERLNEVFSLAKRNKLTFSLVMADLDLFKNINDSFGHDAGDKVLQKFASLVKKFCRTEDLPARFGGEEFIVLLPQTDANGGFYLAERIRTELAGLDILDKNVEITASFGVAELKQGEDQESLIKRVDQSLYKAKEAGRNQSVVSQ